MPFKRTSGTNDFHEVQHFNQWWALAVVAGLALAGWWAFVEQIVMGQPWGNSPAPDAVVLLMWLVFGVGLPVMMRWVRLIVRVKGDALDVRYVPFRHRVIPLSTITSATPRTYRPIREYFGWGIRWVPLRGWVYSVSGDQGVQLVLGGRRKLLIGSRRPEELAAAIVSNQTPDFSGPNDGAGDEKWSGEGEPFGEHRDASEDEPLIESASENGQSATGTQELAGAQWWAAMRAQWWGRTRARGVRASFVPTVSHTIGRAVRWIQAMARRLGASERVQRFAEDPKAHAAAAAECAVEAGRHAGVKAARVGMGVGERVKDNVAQRLRAVPVPSRVAEPGNRCVRYMRNPQLIVDHFRRVG